MDQGFGFVHEILFGCRWPLQHEHNSDRDAEHILVLGTVQGTFLQIGGGVLATESSEKGKKLKSS